MLISLQPFLRGTFLLFAFAALTLTGCDSAPGQNEEETAPSTKKIILTPKEDSYAPMQAATLSVPANAGVERGEYDAEVSGKDVNLVVTEGDDGDIALLYIPEVVAGAQQLEVDFGSGLAGTAELTVTEAPAVADPSAVLEETVGTLQLDLPLVEERLSESGLFSKEAIAADMAKLRAAEEKVRQRLAEASADEKRVAALFVAANPNLFSEELSFGSGSEGARVSTDAQSKSLAFDCRFTGATTPEERWQDLEEYYDDLYSFSSLAREYWRGIRDGLRPTNALARGLRTWATLKRVKDGLVEAVCAVDDILTMTDEIILSDLEGHQDKSSLRSQNNTALRQTIEFKAGESKQFEVRGTYRTVTASDLANASRFGLQMREVLSVIGNLQDLFAEAAEALGLETLLDGILPSSASTRELPVHPRYVTPSVMAAGVDLSYGRDEANGTLSITLNNEEDLTEDLELDLLLRYVHAGSVSFDTEAPALLRGYYFELTGQWYRIIYNQDNSSIIYQTYLIDFGEGGQGIQIGYNIPSNGNECNRLSVEPRYSQEFYPQQSHVRLTVFLWNGSLDYYYTYDPDNPDRLELFSGSTSPSSLQKSNPGSPC